MHKLFNIQFQFILNQTHIVFGYTISVLFNNSNILSLDFIPLQFDYIYYIKALFNI